MKSYRHAVSAVVLRPTGGGEPGGTLAYEVLIVHKPRVHDAWQLPQGGVEPGESVEQAALRELQEETGLLLGPVRYVSSFEYRYDFPPEFIAQTHSNHVGQVLAFVVVFAPPDATVTVDHHEIDAFKWIAPQEFSQHSTRLEYVEVVEKVLKECEGLKSLSH